MNHKKILNLAGAVLILLLFSTTTPADRLPSQMPENQGFTINTLIDITGFATGETRLSWIIDHQDLESKNGVLFNGNDWNLAHQLSAAETLAFDAAGIPYTTARDPNTGNSVLVSINIPTNLLRDLVSTSWDPLVTYQDYLDYLTNGDWYRFSDQIDYGSIHEGRLNPAEEIAFVTYTDSIMTNGGKMSMNKNFGFDSRNKGAGRANLENEKVLTYESAEGAHLVGAEELILDVAGNYEDDTNQTIRCVFAGSSPMILPAFCNVVTAKSELVNFNSGQISTRASVRAIGETAEIPAGMEYQIAVTPDQNTGSGVAEGRVSTTFAGSVMETRDRSNQTSAENTWRDSTVVTGGIANLQKAFTYESGLRV